jgi:Lrp/AsnC family transcriptional regulator, leucine-responsive regulatory protein
VKRLRYRDQDLDAVDVQLLRRLESDGRSSIADLARGLGMAPPSVAERLKRLAEAGVIRRFTVEIDPAALGYALAAYIRIRPTAGQIATVAKLLRELPEIVECDRITGNDCFVARAHVRSVEALERLIDRIVPFAQTNTSIIQSSPVGRRLPPLNGEPGTPGESP